MAKSKKNFTHQVVYSENNHIVVTAPKGWAREHKTFFKNSFVGKDVPRTTKIEKALRELISGSSLASTAFKDDMPFEEKTTASGATYVVGYLDEDTDADMNALTASNSVLLYECSNCGESFSSSDPGRAEATMQIAPPYSVKIKDLNTDTASTDLSGCIRFNSGGCVNTINVNLTNNPIYPYIIYVDAKGPSGMSSGSGYLRFIDFSGDHYDLSIYQSKRGTHYVQYKSPAPCIKTILWSDKKFV